MTVNEFKAIWDKTKALWGGWAKSIEGDHERFNFDVVFKMFANLSPAAVDEAVDRHFAEKGSRKASAFEPVFSRILEIAKDLHFSTLRADPLKAIHETYVSMLPRVIQLEREVEYYDRMAHDHQNSEAERSRYESLVVLGRNQLKKYAGQPLTDLEAAQINRANDWKRRKVSELRGEHDADDGVRNHVRAVPDDVRNFRFSGVPNA